MQVKKIETKQAQDILLQMHRGHGGTHDKSILWIGEYLALMKSPGGSYSCNGPCYMPTSYSVVDPARRKHVRNLGDGRLTKARFAEFVAACEELDKAVPAERQKRIEKAKARETVEAAEHAHGDAYHAVIEAASNGNDSDLLNCAKLFRQATKDLGKVKANA